MLPRENGRARAARAAAASSSSASPRAAAALCRSLPPPSSASVSHSWIVSSSAVTQRMEHAAELPPDALPEGYTAEDAADDRQRSLDEVQAVSAIYGDEAFSTASELLRAFIESGESSSMPDSAAIQFQLRLPVETEAGDGAVGLNLSCELPRGYPSCRPAVVSGTLERPAARRPWEDHDLLKSTYSIPPLFFLHSRCSPVRDCRGTADAAARVLVLGLWEHSAAAGTELGASRRGVGV